MIVKRTADVLTVLIGGFIIYIGIAYLIAPETSVTGFGLPAWPTGDAAAFLNLKGVRDIASGIIPLTLLLLGQRKALGWVLLGAALIPIGDGTVILAWDGGTAAAFGIPYLPAVGVIAAGLLQLRASREVRDDEPAPREAVQAL